MVEELLLTAGADNPAAVRLYARAGFRRYGAEPRALNVDGCFHGEVLMRLPLHPPG